MGFKGVLNFQQKWPLSKGMEFNIEQEELRHRYFSTLMKLVKVISERSLRMVIENPWNTSRETFLQRNFIKPTVIDSNRMKRGDYFVKPTAYWFIGCNNTYGYSEQQDKEQKIVYKVKDKNQQKGICSEERSMISPDYARNFICDFILGKEQDNTLLTLF